MTTKTKEALEFSLLEQLHYFATNYSGSPSQEVYNLICRLIEVLPVEALEVCSISMPSEMDRIHLFFSPAPDHIKDYLSIGISNAGEFDENEYITTTYILKTSKINRTVTTTVITDEEKTRLVDDLFYSTMLLFEPQWQTK